jgi:invasion protein IalB
MARFLARKGVALAFLAALGCAAGSPQAQEELPWSTECSAPAREAEPDCQMQQRAFVTETGQLLMLLTIRVPAATREPVMILQAPVGTYLPAGVRLDVDGGEATTLEYQTCDAQGCYTATAVSAELLEALRGGSKLNLTIEDQQRRSLAIPLSLIGFTEVYARIQ